MSVCPRLPFLPDRIHVTVGSTLESFVCWTAMLSDEAESAGFPLQADDVSIRDRRSQFFP